ncbi:suppressor APC domain-containing protein 2-like [Mobula birostris]|uniref:suppressor APC domain-containing protein 2-like n=1 Tax=Mobula birostris TaxID=1983395 RepID=UPI003B283A99
MSPEARQNTQFDRLSPGSISGLCAGRMASPELSRLVEHLPRDKRRQQPRSPPRTFLFSLRTLFDILEQQSGGTVELRDIERGWPDESSREPALPPGLIPCLRRVADPGGRLTFPRLLAGIRTALEQETEPEGTSHSGEQQHQAKSSPPTGFAHREPGTQGSNAPTTDSGNRALDRSEGPGISRSQSITGSVAQATQRQSSRCRNEPRRHTVTSGIDYDVLKRMKELEKERDALAHGLEMVERVRGWYLQQIHGVRRRQEQARRGLGNADCPADPQPNRACLLLAKIQEVNCCLSDLMSCTGKPPHTQHPVNGFVPAAKAIGFHRQPVNLLQDQNHLLTKELSVKSERIAVLEREKASLIKRLIETRSQGGSEPCYEGSTII